MRARFIQENGTLAWLRVYWGDDCPNAHGSGKLGYHNARVYLSESDQVGDWSLGGSPDDYPDDRWPVKCDHCAAVPPPSARRQVFHQRRYDSPEKTPQPGDLYFGDWYKTKDGSSCVFHDNCDGRHLFAILPNGNVWDIDGRASNCTRPDDRNHRCWVRSGEPPDITVSKNGGDTCSAGGGSIMSGDYHGFLQGGNFT